MGILTGGSEMFENLKGLAIERNKLFKEVDELCKKHKVPFVQYLDKHSFCPICASERAEESDKEMLEKETKRAYSQNKRWLRQRSILTDKEMLNMNFDNFKTDDEETKLNKEKALQIARRIYKESKDNEMLAGKFGTGKTHLAMAILNQLNEYTDLKLMFVSIDELMRRIKSNFKNFDSPYKEDVIVQTLTEADVLVIDDLGAEVGSVDRNSEATDYNVRVLNAVLSGRMNKPTIFTTNLNNENLRDMYDGRIVSRILKGMTQERVITFKTTTDKRSKIKF